MIVLFDNYDGYDFETIKEELEELNGIAPTEQDVYYLIAIREEKDWKETKELLEQIDSCFGFIIKGMQDFGQASTSVWTDITLWKKCCKRF